MRVLLINPYYPISETPSPSLALAFLAGELERHNVEVRVLDFVVFPYSVETLHYELQHFKPHVTGITAVTMTFEHAADILDQTKRVLPQTTTVCGGPHITYDAENALKKHPAIDIAVLGEGEGTLVEIVRAIESDRALDTVAGLVFRNGDRAIRTACRKPMDINRLPLPARHLMPLGRYRTLGLPLTLTTSRGCPYKCSFCVGRKMGGESVRYRSPDLVADELEQIVSVGFHQVNIADDLFTANHRHCRKICNEILRRELPIRWTAFARGDTVSETLLKQMKAAGCQAISFGVESANPGILAAIRKGIMPQQVIKAVELCLQTGVTPYASFILGLPGETAETLQETVTFARKLQSMGAGYGFHLLAPFPGTEIRRTLKKHHMGLLTNDWSQYHANRAIVDSPGADKEMLDEIVINWEKEFDAYLDDIKKKMKHGSATTEEKGQIEGLERMAVVYDLMMNRAIERLGKWTENGCHTKPNYLNALINRIKDEVVHSEKELSAALQFCKEKNYLRLVRKENRIKWEWVDYL